MNSRKTRNLHLLDSRDPTVLCPEDVASKVQTDFYHFNTKFRSHFEGEGRQYSHAATPGGQKCTKSNFWHFCA